MNTNDKITNILKDFLLAVAAGMAIALGGIAFLSAPNKAVGSIYFAIGLFTVCYFKLNLYTGKVCYVFDNKPSYIGKLATILAGNFVGATLIGAIASFTRLSSTLGDTVTAVANTKLGDNLLSIFILAILCDICIFIAVDGYAKAEHGVIKITALLFGVAVFVLCGFEHCVANMFYFTFANVWSWKALLYMLVMIAGNSVGGVILPLILKATKKE
ncbi:MAG: formate/nitrite transporter family protein [Clostridia bacterium]|nr:formate/nitrite transporter family protein [Clostridia bacterium]